MGLPLRGCLQNWRSRRSFWRPHERSGELSPDRRWRTIGADSWNRAHLDLCGPAALTIIAEARASIIRPLDPLRMTVGLGQAGVGDDAVAILSDACPRSRGWPLSLSL
jgi:hypothetical protein